MKKDKTIQAWAIVNWTGKGIVNDGYGQKRIYRTKKIAKEENLPQYGTKVVKVEIKILNEKTQTKKSPKIKKRKPKNIIKYRAKKG